MADNSTLNLMLKIRADLADASRALQGLAGDVEDVGSAATTSSQKLSTTARAQAGNHRPEPPGGGGGAGGGQDKGKGQGQQSPPGKNDNPDNDVLEAPDKSEAAEAQARATVNKAINVVKPGRPGPAAKYSCRNTTPRDSRR